MPRIPFERKNYLTTDQRTERANNTPDSHRLVTKSDRVEPLTTVTKQDIVEVLKEMVLDFRDLDQTRANLELSSDFNPKDLFEMVVRMQSNLSP